MFNFFKKNKKKKINEIICIGTSFTEGDGLNPKKDIDGAVAWYFHNKNIRIESINQYCWPTILQKICRVPVTNLGKSGSSIEYLIRNVEEIIENKNCKNKLFILEYSSWGRSELWFRPFEKWVVANWGPRNGKDETDGYATMISTDYNFGEQLDEQYFKIYEKYLDHFFNEHEYLIQRDRHFLNLLYKLKSLNISYQVIKLENPYLHDMDNHKLFNFKDILNEDLWGYVGKNNLTITYDTLGNIVNDHPSIEGHNHLAKLFYDKLKNTYQI